MRYDKPRLAEVFIAVGGKKPYGQLQAALDAGGDSMALWAYPTAMGPDEDGFRVSEIT